MTSTTVKTFCRTCSGHCGMEIEVSNNKIINVKGDRQHPLTKGYFCIKGLESADFHNSEGADKRLLQSQKKRADGSFDNIDAEIAMDEIAGRLTRIVDKYGPESIGIWAGTASYMGSKIITAHGLMKSFMAELGTPYMFTGMTLDQSAKWVTLMRMGTFATGKPSIENLNALMLIGTNPLVSHQGQPLNSASGWNPGKTFRAAKQNGLKLIVVDPRATETARLADLHLQIIPGEDAALMAGIIKIILDNEWHDKAFCDRFVDKLETLKDTVKEFDLGYVAQRTGVPEEKILEAAKILGTEQRVSVGSGTGSNMAPDCNIAEHLTECLNAILGGYKRAGDVTGTPGLINKNIGVEGVYPSLRQWTTGAKLPVENAGPLFGEYPSALLPKAIESGQIKALIVLAGNPAVAIGNPAKTSAALNSLELMVTIDPRMTESAEISDYVIAAALPFERHDIPVLVEAWAPTPYLQYTPPVIEKPAAMLEDWEFIWGLARRMGKQLELKVGPYGAIYKQLPEGLKLNMQQKPDIEALLAWIMKDAPISYAELKAHQGTLIPDVETLVIQPVASDNLNRLDLMPDDVIDELVAYRHKAGDSS